MARVCLVALLLGSAYAGRISRSMNNDLDLEKLVGDLKKDGICGSETIPGELSEGKSVDSIRGIQWNAIFKTAKQFVAHRTSDADQLKKEVHSFQDELSDLVAKRDAAKAPDVDNKDLQDMIGVAVSSSFGSVEEAEKKLCWGGSMQTSDDANAAFNTAMTDKMETATTNVEKVQEACLAMLIKEHHDVNFCSELCNAFGQTAAKAAASSKRVRSFVSLEERIGKLETSVTSKSSEIAAIEQQVVECNQDQDILSQHREKLTSLNGVINKEKIGIFMTRFELGAAESDLATLVADNKDLYKNTKDLEAVARKAGIYKDEVKDNLQTLKREELKLNRDLQQQTKEVEKLDGKVKTAGSATETIIEFKSSLQRMLLVWIEYYKKSVIEPLERVDSLFPNASFPEIADLKHRSEDAAHGLSDFCKSEETQTALNSLPSLPELASICDKQVMDWEGSIDRMDQHVMSRQNDQIEFVNELAHNLSIVERKYAYKGPKLSGILGEVEGVWQMRAFFYDTPMYKKYLKGWKAIAPDMIQALRKKGWKGSVDDLFDGRWMRLCEKLDHAFKDATDEYDHGKEKLQDVINDFEDVMAQVEKVGAEFTKADGSHALAKDLARTSNEELTKMKAQEKDMNEKVHGLNDKHDRSLHALREAEKAYTSSHSAALE